MKQLLISLIVIISGATAKAQCTKLFDFTGTANGSYPYGSLYSDGTFLYGMTQAGGTYSMGTIFKIKPDGSTYSKLLDFAGASNGSGPWGTLISDGTFLYGMTEQGGTNSTGVIFKIKPDGSSYSKLIDFTGANGLYPYGSLISDGTYLYGMTQGGGSNTFGTIFKIKPDGSAYTKLLDFAGPNGKYPFSSLISDGTFLYGMTLQGGANGQGVIFKIKPDGTGYANLFDFVAASGYYTTGSLISDGAFLYGTTQKGGVNNYGTIFKIKFDGTGYSNLFDFSGTNGKWPCGSLVSDGTFLYGTTQSGGSNTNGVIFAIKPDGTGYSKLFDFTGAANGSQPFGSLIFDGTFLYGMTTQGGIGACTGGCGVVFKYALNVGIRENDQAVNKTIYPNPSAGIFKIETAGKLEIFNSLGEKIYDQNLTSEKTEIDISDKGKGIYFIKVYDSNSLNYYTGKIVVQL